jgi:hypothetical protein
MLLRGVTEVEQGGGGDVGRRERKRSNKEGERRLGID